MAAAVLCGGVAAEAANLVVTAPSNYAQSVMGVVRGSRVKTDIWGIGKDLRTDLNGDPGLFHLHVNGDSKIFLRQYTYSQTNLKTNELLDAENNQWSAGKHGNNFHDGEYPRRGVLGELPHRHRL
jgi:hypothetical protein